MLGTVIKTTEFLFDAKAVIIHICEGGGLINFIKLPLVTSTYNIKKWLKHKSSSASF
jgi:hypothetical protein